MQYRSLPQIKRRLEKYKTYVLAREIKRSFDTTFRKSNTLRVLSLAPEQRCQGYVLLSYVTDAFFLTPGQAIPNTHTNYWAALQMARTFLDLHYGVDVIHYHNSEFLPEKDYCFFVDVRRNLERLAPLMNQDCIKIMHLDTAHILFHNAAEARRLLELQQRRGVTLRPRRFELPNLGIEHADCATTTGNAFTIETFRYAHKPIYRLPIPAAVRAPWPAEKDWEACRRSFLWFSSGGLVHKGLDLALEAFLEMPEYHLIVCAPLDQEEDFTRVYHKELYQTQNIHSVGWVDVNSIKFREICNNCIGVILLSCSEGASVSSANCMHTGLIPIVSYACGLDIDGFGFPLQDCSIEKVKEAIRKVANLPIQELKERARQSWEFAQTNHTREKFTEEYRKVITQIITEGINNTGIPDIED